MLSIDIPTTAVQIARENAADAQLANTEVEEVFVFPYLGWFDWVIDLIDRVGIAFDEELDPASAETAGDYSVSGVSVTGARLVGNSGQWVLLNVSGTPADGFTVTADGVKDLAGNATDNATATGELSDMQTEDVGDPGVDPLLEGDAG